MTTRPSIRACCIYNSVRLVIIGLTLVAMARLYYKMWQVINGYDRHFSPLYHLTRRLLFYPLVQVVCRLGSTPYIAIYKSTIDTYPEHAGFMQTVLLFLGLAPTAGFGGLLVFIHMQRGAKEILKNMLKGAICCSCKAQSVSEKQAIQEAITIVSKSNRHSELTAASPHYGDDDVTINSRNRPSSLHGDRDSHATLERNRLSIMDESDLMKECVAEVASLASRGSITTSSNIELGSSSQPSDARLVVCFFPVCSFRVRRIRYVADCRDGGCEWGQGCRQQQPGTWTPRFERGRGGVA
jgi:hypothetical protein